MDIFTSLMSSCYCDATEMSLLVETLERLEAAQREGAAAVARDVA